MFLGNYWEVAVKVRRNVVVVLGCAAALLAASCSGSDGASPPAARAPERAPANPYLAASAYAVSHHDSAQQDNSPLAGPTGPSRTLSTDDVDWQFLGPGHFGSVLSSPYPDGRRVLWSNGGDRIAKLDADTFEVLATFALPGKEQWTEAAAEDALAQVTDAAPADRPAQAVGLAAKTLVGLAGVYAMIDRDGNLYLSDGDGITVYGDQEPGDPTSPIVLRRRWTAPADVSGALVGMNMTYDGWIVLVTEDGDVLALSRDLTTLHRTRLRHSDQAQAYTAAAQAAGRTGYGWVRNSYAIDDRGGIYVISAGYLHKVVWTGHDLSSDEADGAWSEPYPDGTGLGSGATPVLMGFGPHEDHLVAFTDGDQVMRETVYWRDDIPEGWEPPAGAVSARAAGALRADMGDPSRTAIQTEQASVVAGYGAVVVNNQPASIPAGFPTGRAATLLVGYLGNDPRFTPHGMQKFAWDPKADRLRVAWVNTEVASPNSVPFISTGSGLVYTVGARDGAWTLEGVDWRTGRSRFHDVLPGPAFNSLFAGLTLDQHGNIVYGTPFGKARIRR
jgi:hypothetical protein